MVAQQAQQGAATCQQAQRGHTQGHEQGQGPGGPLLGPALDVFSLGAVMYCAFTGG